LIHFHTRRVIEDRHGLRTERARGLREAEQLVEPHRALEVVHTDTDVGKARDRDGISLCLRDCHFASWCVGCASKEPLVYAPRSWRGMQIRHHIASLESLARMLG